MTRERDRYERAGTREQVGDLFRWLRAHPILGVLAILAILGAISVAIGPPRSVQPSALAPGDCLYAWTSSSSNIGEDGRPVGDPGAVEAAVMAGASERTGCDQSHGHEVSLVVPLDDLAGVPFPGRAALVERVGPSCADAFEGYVGHPPGGSLYETFAAVPAASTWSDGGRTAVCLVVRVDGRWMDHPARGSGE